MEYFCRSGALLEFPELVRGYGENPAALLREVGLSTAVLFDSELYLPYLKVAALFSVAAERCRAPDFGVQLGSRQGLLVPGALASIMCAQSSVPSALQLMQRNLDFHALGARVDVQSLDARIEMRLSFAFVDACDCEQLSGHGVALLCRVIEQLHGNKLRPVACSLRRANEKMAGSFASLFHCPTEAEAKEDLLVFPAELMALPVDVEPDLRAQLGQQWRGNWQRTQPVSLIQQTERAMAALLPTGECSLDMVSRLVDRSPRSLQAELKKQQKSFSSLLQRTRLRLACQHLRSSDMDLTTLAMNLGFAELAVFSRAFKLWTGTSPREWRQRSRQGEKLPA